MQDSCLFPIYPEERTRVVGDDIVHACVDGGLGGCVDDGFAVHRVREDPNLSLELVDI